MALAPKTGARGTEGLGAEIHVSNDGGDVWHRLRGAADTTYSPGDRDSGTTQTYEGAVSYLGQEQVGDVGIQFPAWSPNLNPWRIVQAAKKANADLLFRIRTAPATVRLASLATRTMSIANVLSAVNAEKEQYGALASIAAPAAGAAGRRALDALVTGNPIKVGHVIRVKGDQGEDKGIWRTIEEIEVDAEVANGAADRWKMYVLPKPAQAVDAEIFEIQTPRYDHTFVAGVKNFNQFSIPASGTYGTALTLTPNEPLDLADLANDLPDFP